MEKVRGAGGAEGRLLQRCSAVLADWRRPGSSSASLGAAATNGRRWKARTAGRRFHNTGVEVSGRWLRARGEDVLSAGEGDGGGGIRSTARGGGEGEGTRTGAGPIRLISRSLTGDAPLECIGKRPCTYRCHRRQFTADYYRRGRAAAGILIEHVQYWHRTVYRSCRS